MTEFEKMARDMKEYPDEVLGKELKREDHNKDVFKLIPSRWEIYTEDETLLVATFKAFDEDSIEVTIDTLLTSEELRNIADKLAIAEQQYQKGF